MLAALLYIALGLLILLLLYLNSKWGCCYGDENKWDDT
jgi:hypothetical protein